MQEGTDWRQNAHYDYIEHLDAGDIAWEFLRRNADYKRAYQQIPKRRGATEPFTRRWGLRFPGCASAPRAEDRHLLDARGRSGNPNRRALACNA